MLGKVAQEVGMCLSTGGRSGQGKMKAVTRRHGQRELPLSSRFVSKGVPGTVVKICDLGKHASAA